MKSAICFLRASTSTNPKASALYGSQFVPASLVMELYQALQAGHYDPKDSDSQTGEPRFKLNISLWREDGSKGYVLSGHLESPAESAARQANRAPAGAPAPGGWGAPPAAPPAAPPGYGQPQAPAPAWGAPPPPGYGQPPAPAPAPALAPAPGWGGGGGWGVAGP